MAAHTLIIDLFGLPACGKSTLTQYLCENNETDLRVETLQMVLHKMGKLERIKLLFSFSLKQFLVSLYIQIVVKLDKRHERVLWFSWYRHGLYYQYIKKYSDCDVVLVDHGDVQSFVSIEHGKDLHSKKTFVNACKYYLSLSPASIYVFCKIGVDDSLNRIKKRNRFYSGRIDKLGSDNLRLIELEKEKERFDFFFQMVKNCRKRVEILDMNKELPEIAKDLLSYIKH